jgi:hypothetical protein
LKKLIEGTTGAKQKLLKKLTEGTTGAKQML